MASPLTMYVPIKQDPATQSIAEAAISTFTEGVKKGLNDTKIVHYATLALVPNTDGKGTLGILLMTDFDLAMDPYLETFWKIGIGEAIAAIAGIALIPPGPINTLTEFENFINSVNLTPAPAGDDTWTNFYQAYPQTVKQILALTA